MTLGSQLPFSSFQPSNSLVLTQLPTAEWTALQVMREKGKGEVLWLVFMASDKSLTRSPSLAFWLKWPQIFWFLFGNRFPKQKIGLYLWYHFYDSPVCPKKFVLFFDITKQQWFGLFASWTNRSESMRRHLQSICILDINRFYYRLGINYKKLKCLHAFFKTCNKK